MAIKKKFIQVEEDYIKQIHSEVCSEWKAKLETKFPILFPKFNIKLNQVFQTVDYKQVVFKRHPLNTTTIMVYYGNGKSISDWDAMEVTTDIVDVNNITKQEVTDLVGTPIFYLI